MGKKVPLAESLKYYDLAAVADSSAPWREIARSTILVLGSPRSGTTWLAKIVDSHPDILYRHEPDEVEAPADSESPLDQLALWLSVRAMRVSAKRPAFRKSWRPLPLHAARQATYWMAAALHRADLRPAAALPDFVAPRRWNRVRPAMKLVNWNGVAAMRALPETRGIFLLRHPCGQVASMLAGLADHRFGDPAASAGLAAEVGRAANFAADRGVSTDGFASLTPAAQWAWAWLAFNEPAVEAMSQLPNVRVIVYELLCADPEPVGRELFGFAGLDWTPQTTEFLAASSHAKGGDDYFGVYRSGAAVAERWRQTLKAEDQDMIKRIVAPSPLARFWPDLGGAGTIHIGGTPAAAVVAT